MFVRGVPAQKYRDEGYKGGEEPGSSDHAHRRIGVHEVIIVKRLADRVKPVGIDIFNSGSYWKTEKNRGFTCQMKWRTNGEWRRLRHEHQSSSKSHKLRTRRSI